MAEELYIGVGCVEAQWLPFAVLRHSIQSRTKSQVRVEPLYSAGIELPVPREPRNRQKTPFSFQRFLIPEICGYRGLAMYLDSDMLVFDDIASLFKRDFGDDNVLAVPKETSVIVLDCERLTWDIRKLVVDLDEGRLSYDGLMTCRSVAQVRYDLPATWNWLDNSGAAPPSDLSLLHYTLTSSQPWLTAGHPLGHLWLTALYDAIDSGDIELGDVESAVNNGFVRPSLLYQTEHRLLHKVEIPKEIAERDSPFSEFCRSVQYVVVEGMRR